MGHVTSKQPWGTLDIDTDAGVVLVREDWHYTWTSDPGVPAYNITQKRNFHNRLDREIWGKWSWHFHVHTEGSAPFAARFAKEPLVINFDIRWVLHGGDWEVEVVVLRTGAAMSNATRSWVDFDNRKIKLYSLIFVPYTAMSSAGESKPGFRTGPHEFGHTLHYPDDYTPTSPFLRDTDSIMNVGQQLRDRHIQLILDTLNTMVPGVTFSPES